MQYAPAIRTHRELRMADDVVAIGGRFDAIEESFHAALDATLDPRGPDSLFDLVSAMGLPAGSSVVDVGCGRGRQAVELVRRFGFSVLGIDPLYRAADAARQAETLAPGAVRFADGTAESIPVDDAHVDLIFCRESLMYADLLAAVSEFVRVLRPGGRGLVYLVLNGPRITAAEVEELWAPLAPALRPGGVHGANSLHPADIEHALRHAGLTVDEQVDYGSEWGERSQEQNGTAGQRLLYAARLLRQPDRYIEQFGRANYDIMLGDCLWHIYRMLGKLTGYAVTFTKPELSFHPR
jgi:SAM-dependent methyltransferase